MGSSVVSGSARVLISQTGSPSALGQIAHSLAQPAPSTDFERGTRRPAFQPADHAPDRAAVLFTLLVNVAFAHPLLQSFLFALALGLTPELLPPLSSSCWPLWRWCT